MLKASDQELLASMCAGDSDAYGVLVARHAALVQTACRRQAPSADVDDAVQAVFLILAKRPAAAAKAPALEAWLMKVAWYVCRRSQRAAHRRWLAERSAAAQQSNAPSTRPEALDHLDECLSKLPEKQRIAVSLRFLANKTPEDIATLLGTSRDNAYQLVSRGLATLRVLLEKRGVAVGSATLISLLGAEGHAAATCAPPALVSSVITSTTATPSASVAALVQGAQSAMFITAAVPFATAAGLILTAGSLTVALAADPSAGNQAPSVAKPAWASEIGSDASGTWAKLTVDGQTQILRLIPAGKFDMGAEDGEADEKPVRKVEISTPFWLADSETTQGFWQVVMITNPSRFNNDISLPVEQVAWSDTQEFLEKLNGKVSGLNATLPTEAQWEYACRAGSTGDFAGAADFMAWTKQNSDTKSHPVKTKAPNAWGLFDMYGNVNEWCSDWYGFGTYTTGAPINPTGPDTGDYRVIRGGGWFGNATRSADRQAMKPDSKDGQIGFRIAISAAL